MYSLTITIESGAVRSIHVALPLTIILYDERKIRRFNLQEFCGCIKLDIVAFPQSIASGEPTLLIVSRVVVISGREA